MAADEGAPAVVRQGTAEARPARNGGDGGGEGTGEQAHGGPAVELLVHGVGGATPQEMLQDPRTVRVTGDATASIHRRAGDLDERPWTPGEPVREAYTWSNLTSGNGARALWLLLLPFMIVNMAHWMRPAAAEPHAAHRLFDILVRLLALTLTVLLTAGTCAVCLDLIAWQCAASLSCAEDASWLGPLASGEGWWGRPGRRLALAAVVPAGLTALLWWLSHRTWSAYESASPPVRARAQEPGAGVLSLPGFWYGRGLVSRLRAAHTAAALLTVAAALLAATWSHDLGTDGQGQAGLLCRLLAVLLGLCALAVVVLVVRDGRTEDEPDQQPVPPWTGALPWASLALLLVAAVHAASGRPGWETAGRLPGAGYVFPVLVAVQGVLVVGLALTARRLHRRAPAADRGALAGLGGPAVALLACALGAVLTGGVVQRAADWLETDAGPGGADVSMAGPPVLLSWQAAAIPTVLAVPAVFAAVAFLRARRCSRRLAPRIRGRYPQESCETQADRSRRIASAVARAALTDSAPTLVGWITGTGLVLAVAAAGGSLTGEPPARAAEGAPAAVAALAGLSQTLGSWLMGIGVLVLLALGRQAYRDPGARRTVGILWDVGTFWPRAAHPFAPPCYAERAVPDLSWRMGTWVDATGGRLIISGHSQGSVLAAAAVWQLDTATRSRIGLLTYGAPLRRLYGPWFPRYFGPGALASLHRDVPCWRNLWRDTDPIGGPVLVTGEGDPQGRPVDREPLTDPLHYGRNLRRPLPDPVLGHGEYDADPAFDEERADLFRRLDRGAADAAAPAGLPGQPRGGRSSA